MMGRDVIGTDDVQWLEERLADASASRLLDHDLDVSEIRRRLVVRSKRRRVAVGGLAVAVMAAMFSVVSRSPQPIDTVSRRSVTEVRPQAPGDSDQKAIESESEVGSDLELERLVAAAEAAQLYAEEYQAKLNAMKRDRELRIQEAAVAKLIREQARQEYWLSLAKSGE